MSGHVYIDLHSWVSARLLSESTCVRVTGSLGGVGKNIMGTREVYEEKLRSGNLYHDPTINPGLGSPRCPRCLSLLIPDSVRPHTLSLAFVPFVFRVQCLRPVWWVYSYVNFLFVFCFDDSGKGWMDHHFRPTRRHCCGQFLLFSARLIFFNSFIGYVWLGSAFWMNSCGMGFMFPSKKLWITKYELGF